MQTSEQRANHLLYQMTLEEKLAQMGSYWIFDLQTNGILDWEKTSRLLQHGIGQITRMAGASTLAPNAAAKTANGLQRYLVEKTRLGIPAILHEECCAGAMVLRGTVFPQMLGLASAFQPELAKEMTAAIREQLLAVGIRQALAPVLDIVRDPRWGRVEETFGEDPLLVSHYGMAYIRGLQTDDLQHGVIATGKHFVGHSLSQGGLNCAPVYMGMREIEDVFLVPFRAAIRDAGLASVMNAYPEIDGEVVGASRRILTDLLRSEIGFNGLLVSDYEAVSMLHTFHKIAEDLSSAAARALIAGIDVELPNTVCYGDPLRLALEKGQINLELIDRAVQRHLKAKFDLGLFEDPYVNEEKALEVYDSTAQRNLARKIARQSMVLLKNDGTLPLQKNIRKLAVIGPSADSQRNLLADYSYTAMSELMRFKQTENSAFISCDFEQLARDGVPIVSILSGIQAAVSSNTELFYTPGCDYRGDDPSGIEAAVQAAEQSDAVILVLGDRSGLTPDCTTGETRDSADLRLPGLQENLFRAVCAAGKPVAVVLVTGRPYDLSRVVTDANAILQAWLPGEEGGPAVADILFGDANPGGKLPITFPRSVGQIPVFYNRKPAGTTSHWYGDYVFQPTAPLFPFGHGLSYTSFEYRDLVISPLQAKAGESVDISATIKNSGPAEGDEVVQLYIHDVYASVPRPVKELKAYRRITLKPGESRRIVFHLPISQLAFVNLDHTLALEAGEIEIMVGSSSADIRLWGSLEITAPAQIPFQEAVYICPVSIEMDLTATM